MNKFTFSIFILIFIIVGPWWMALSMICLGCIAFKNFYSGIVFAGIMDIMYGHFAVWQDLLKSYTLIIFVLFVVMLFLHPKLRVYSGR